MDNRIVTKKLEIIHRRSVVEKSVVSDWRVCTADYEAPGVYRRRSDWTRGKDCSRWRAGKTVFVTFETQLPETSTCFRRYMCFDTEKLEGMVNVNGQAYAGVDDNHQRLPMICVGKLVVDGEFISVPEVMGRPELENEESSLRQIRFECIDLEIESAWYDMRFAWEAGEAIPHERRRLRILQALEEALLAIDLTLPFDRFRNAVAQARTQFRRMITVIGEDPEECRIFLTGHSHLDTAWSWTLSETIRKCGRTFSTACLLMSIYPRFRFSCSQPQLYQFTKEYFPSLYDKIRQRIGEGRWEATGGMWVEADCNIPSGESLIRQILFGLRFFQEEFGRRPRTCWLPDVFGYPGNLPQILVGCGLKGFYTTKLHWQARNRFPYHLFLWEGIDGTDILAHIPRLKRNYNGWPRPEQLIFAAENFNQRDVYDELLFPFGFGDGGGGPTEEMLEFAERAEHFPGLPSCRQGKEEEFFERVEAQKPDLPVWKGELYLETHRGTLTSQASTKRHNRTNELLLRDAEIMGAMARILSEDADVVSLQAAWKDLLLHQFHDILPGSSIGAVYEDTAGDHAQIETMARSALEGSLEIILKHLPSYDVVVFNTLAWNRESVAAVTLDRRHAESELIDQEGRAIPLQKVAEHGKEVDVIFTPPNVPALGYAVLQLRPRTLNVSSAFCVSEDRMENDFFVVDIDERGQITRLLDKRHDREIVPSGAAANRLQLFQDGPEREAAWNVHSTFYRREYTFEGECSREVREVGPVRVSVRVVRQHRNSRFVQDIVIYAAVPRIDFVTNVDWHERQVLVKSAFPVEVRSDYATFEIQFGAIRRPTHRNTSWDQEKFEVPAHRWADISEAGYGVSLLNDGKYGYDVEGNILRLSLLRGPEWPDPTSDEGLHTFTYSLYPHSGDWHAGGTVQQALELNVPLRCYLSRNDRTEVSKAGAQLPGSGSFLQILGPAILETLKEAEDGAGWIVRFYEPYGSRGTVTVTVLFELQEVRACNLVEEDENPHSFQGNSFSFVILPFQIKTFRIRVCWKQQSCITRRQR